MSFIPERKENTSEQLRPYPGADPGFEIRGGGIKKNSPSGGRRENFGGIPCEKSRFYTKKLNFSNFRGARAGCAPPGSAPDININIETLLFGNDKYSYGVNSKIFGKVRTFINQSKRF